MNSEADLAGICYIQFSVSIQHCWWLP